MNASHEANTFCDIWGIPKDKVLVDETGDYARELRIPGVPTNVLIDAQGTVRAVGVTTPAELRLAVDDLLSSPRGRDGDG